MSANFRRAFVFHPDRMRCRTNRRLQHLFDVRTAEQRKVAVAPYDASFAAWQLGFRKRNPFDRVREAIR